MLFSGELVTGQSEQLARYNAQTFAAGATALAQEANRSGGRVEISSNESEIKNFREGSDYLVSDNGRGEKTYTVRFDVNSPDEFVVLDIGNSYRDTSSPIEKKREVFIQSARKIEESERRIEESERRIRYSQAGQLRVDPESKSNVFFSIEKNEKDLLSKWENEGLFQNSPSVSGVENNKDNQQQDKVFTQRQQIPPKK
ncbi:4493_t:CDS:2 [Entrophospora sp. SA101]|nr:4483_t:CDS:2 [Entrophospora sp. SA101]CAJ0902167.1 4493_t:CDS:2 [Entrophospora sp. SA101]